MVLNLGDSCRSEIFVRPITWTWFANAQDAEDGDENGEPMAVGVPKRNTRRAPTIV